jgi:hypothetical protein
MKNLYQKLSKENKKKIVDFTKQYPTTGNILTQSLKSSLLWSHLSLGNALEIWNTIEHFKPFDFDKFINLFKNK